MRSKFLNMEKQDIKNPEKNGLQCKPWVPRATSNHGAFEGVNLKDAGMEWTDRHDSCLISIWIHRIQHIGWQRVSTQPLVDWQWHKSHLRLTPETNSSWISVAGRFLSASLALRPRERRWWQLFAYKRAHSSKKTYRFNTINKKKLMCIRLINYAKHQKICLWKRKANCSTNWGGNIYGHETSWDCATPWDRTPQCLSTALRLYCKLISQLDILEDMETRQTPSSLSVYAASFSTA